MFPDIIADLIDDAQLWRHPTSLRVYRELRRVQNIYYEPQRVKAWLLATELHTNRRVIQRALELLIRRGFVIECGRGQNGVRQLMLARERDPLYRNGTTPTS